MGGSDALLTSSLVFTHGHHVCRRCVGRGALGIVRRESGRRRACPKHWKAIMSCFAQTPTGALETLSGTRLRNSGRRPTHGVSRGSTLSSRATNGTGIRSAVRHARFHHACDHMDASVGRPDQSADPSLIRARRRIRVGSAYADARGGSADPNRGNEGDVDSV